MDCTHLEEKKETPVEDLCAEHGLLNRILLIYEEYIYALNTGLNVNYLNIHTAAKIIRDFIEDYHEKNEEKYIFPVVQKCKKYKKLIKTLLEQHQMGRVWTQTILDLSLKEDPKINLQIAVAMQKFVTMYRAHESREDTVVFRVFHQLTEDTEYLKLGNMMEKVEEQKFGEDDYDHLLKQIENIEKSLGIYDLAIYSNINF